MVDEFEGVDVHRISDFYHAAGRLGEVVSIVDAAKTQGARMRRFHALKGMLWEGRIKPLAKKLRAFACAAAPEPETLASLSSQPEAKQLWEHTFYFERNAATMDYPAYRARGWPISSGSVESACLSVDRQAAASATG